MTGYKENSNSPETVEILKAKPRLMVRYGSLIAASVTIFLLGLMSTIKIEKTSTVKAALDLDGNAINAAVSGKLIKLVSEATYLQKDQPVAAIKNSESDSLKVRIIRQMRLIPLPRVNTDSTQNAKLALLHTDLNLFNSKFILKAPVRGKVHFTSVAGNHQIQQGNAVFNMEADSIFLKINLQPKRELKRGQRLVYNFEGAKQTNDTAKVLSVKTNDTLTQNKIVTICLAKRDVIYGRKLTHSPQIEIILPDEKENLMEQLLGRIKVKFFLSK